jgi:hypothetical protein
MVAPVFPVRPIPGLEPYNPDESVPLGAACRLGLVPGHDGRRASPAEVSAWTRIGFPVRPFGPRYLFPAAAVDGRLRTTVSWCAAWVRFVGRVQAADRLRAGPPTATVGGRSSDHSAGRSLA